MTVNDTVKHYFDILGFGDRYGEYLPELLKCAAEHSTDSLGKDELKEIGKPALNLAWLLYRCRRLEEKYKELGISLEIFLDTVSDIKVWADTYFSCNGVLGLGEINWLLYHMEFRLFKLGRLQFAFGKAECDAPEKGLTKGEDIIEVHIPEGAPLTREECIRSFDAAEIFFGRYFPEYKYRFYTCHSWLLDANLKKLLKENSNILGFARFFDVVDSQESYAGIRYIFNWNDTKESILEKYYPEGTLRARMKSYIKSGGVLEESYGIIKR